MTRLAIVLLLLECCTGSRAGAPAASISSAGPHAAAETLLVGKMAFGLCGMLFITAQPPELIEASQHFSRAAEDLVAGRQREAGGDYLSGASALRRGQTHADLDIVYNRRVAYANGINTWLALRLVQEARQALLLAVAEDSELAGELRQAADSLPAPMRCTPP